MPASVKLQINSSLLLAMMVTDVDLQVAPIFDPLPLHASMASLLPIGFLSVDPIKESKNLSSVQ